MFFRKLKLPDVSDIIAINAEHLTSNVAELSYLRSRLWRKTQKVETLSLPTTEIDRATRDGHFLNIRVEGSASGVDLINPEFFSCAIMGRWTDEGRDQTLLMNAFASTNNPQFGVPYSPKDENLDRRLPDWVRIQTKDVSGREASVIKVNP